MFEFDLILAYISVVSSVKKEVSFVDVKSSLVAVYVSPSSVPTIAPVDLVVSLPLRKSPIVPSVMVLPSVQLSLLEHHVQFRAGL